MAWLHKPSGRLLRAVDVMEILRGRKQRVQEHILRSYSRIRYNTGRFIMYPGITKMYYRKTVGHVFTKPVQKEGTTQKFTETGCLCKQKSSGRPLTAEDDDEWVRANFLQSPKKSAGTAAKELSMSKTTVWRVLCSVWCEQFH